ncbi:hypothetical protein TNCV_794521 [Trichonephila clavipes]|nr:hypothetical protein TNCV_794521 [Trichonephila clavipes]
MLSPSIFISVRIDIHLLHSNDSPLAASAACFPNHALTPAQPLLSWNENYQPLYAQVPLSISSGPPPHP